MTFPLSFFYYFELFLSSFIKMHSFSTQVSTQKQEHFIKLQKKWRPENLVLYLQQHYTSPLVFQATYTCCKGNGTELNYVPALCHVRLSDIQRSFITLFVEVCGRNSWPHVYDTTTPWLATVLVRGLIRRHLFSKVLAICNHWWFWFTASTSFLAIAAFWYCRTSGRFF